MLLLRTQLAILQAKPEFASLKQAIQTIASALEGQSAAAIKAEIMLISAVAGYEWWDDVTLPMLDIRARAVA